MSVAPAVSLLEALDARCRVAQAQSSAAERLALDRIQQRIRNELEQLKDWDEDIDGFAPDVIKRVQQLAEKLALHLPPVDISPGVQLKLPLWRPTAPVQHTVRWDGAGWHLDPGRSGRVFRQREVLEQALTGPFVTNDLELWRSQSGPYSADLGMNL